MWLRFAHGQKWENADISGLCGVSGEAKEVNWDEAFNVAKRFNQQGGLAGFTDWRLPTIDELKTLIDKVKGKHGNYIDADVFPNNHNCFWSSSTGEYGSNSVWIVHFDDGDVSNHFKGGNGTARLVRG